MSLQTEATNQKARPQRPSPTLLFAALFLLSILVAHASLPRPGGEEAAAGNRLGFGEATGNLKREIIRRQYDLKRIEQELLEASKRKNEMEVRMASALEKRDEARRKMRRIIIAQHQAKGGSFFTTLFLPGGFYDTMTRLEILGAVTKKYASQLAKAEADLAKIERDLEEARKETANLMEIKTLLEKRIKELQDHLLSSFCKCPTLPNGFSLPVSPSHCWSSSSSFCLAGLS